MHPVILVGLGGAIGAVARYVAGVAAARWWHNPFPLATMGINIVGSLAMGLLVGWMGRVLPPDQETIRLFIAVGVLGGFTTFSSFSLDVVALIERGGTGQALLYVLVSVVVSVAALWFGLVLMRAGA